MKIISPLVLGFKDTNAVNAALKEIGYEIEGPTTFLFKDSPTVDYLKALGGYKSRTVIAKVPRGVKDISPVLKNYLPRELSGLFGGFDLIAKGAQIKVITLYRN